LELELNAITFDVQLKAQETKELHRSSRTCHAPMRYGHLMKAKNDKLLILWAYQLHEKGGYVMHQ
jgi:hypothetical protein